MANAVSVASAAEGRAMTPREASSWWLRRTLDESGGVAATAAHLGRKALLFWTSDERGSNHSAAAERDFATLLQIVPVITDVSMDANGIPYIESRPVTLEHLETELRSRVELNAELTVQVNGDRNTSYGNMAMMMSVIQKAGVTKVNLITLPTR